MPDPITPERLAEIRRRDEFALRVVDKLDGALDGDAWDRHVGDHAAAMRVITEFASEAAWLDNLDDEENFARPSAPTAEGGEPRG